MNLKLRIHTISVAAYSQMQGKLDISKFLLKLKDLFRTCSGNFVFQKMIDTLKKVKIFSDIHLQKNISSYIQISQILSSQQIISDKMQLTRFD